MRNLFDDIRYSLRVLRQTPVFTLTAVLTLALGLGGTTAIFSLIHAVMLRSLPVADPESLYRIGDGNDCCVEGGPQDRWGMYSFPLFEKLKAALPEFEQVAAFQAGGWRLSVRRANVDRAPRPLRSEFVTGSYFSTFGIRGFGGRLFSEADDQLRLPRLQCSAIGYGRACTAAIQRWLAPATLLRVTPSRLSALLHLVSTVKHCAAIRQISGCRSSKSP